ncbi:MAG: heparinase II/III family protein [Holosporaceae bacterium]|jgi:uncharacterized heparinase superfamily protein
MILPHAMRDMMDGWQRLSEWLRALSPDAAGQLNRGGKVAAHRSLRSPLVSLYHQPSDPWSGRSDLGNRLIAVISESDTASFFALGGRVSGDAELAGLIGDWSPHSFVWLRHLHALGGDPARAYVRMLLQSWLNNRPYLSKAQLAEIDDLAIKGQRVSQWLSHFSFYGASSDSHFQQMVCRALLKEVRQLKRRWLQGTTVEARMTALKGVIFGILALEEDDSDLNFYLKAMEDQLFHSVFQDAPRGRTNASGYVSMLRDLLEIRSLLCAVGHSVPMIIQQSIERLATIVRMFLMPDGKLALVNGSVEESASELEQLLQLATGRAYGLTQQQFRGYYRMAAGRTTLLVDAAPRISQDGGHAGLLSFEMAVGRERLLVNCGTYCGPDAAWYRGLRATAAHSTVGLPASDAYDFAPSPRRVASIPLQPSVEKSEQNNHQLLEMAHDGYLVSHGVRIQRRLYLARDGDDVRGEDIVSGPANTMVEIRFHLHPQVDAGLSQKGDQVILKLPSGGMWKFRADLSGGRGELELTESIYAPQRLVIKRTQQILLRLPIDEDGKVRVQWGIRRPLT